MHAPSFQKTDVFYKNTQAKSVPTGCRSASGPCRESFLSSATVARAIKHVLAICPNSPPSSQTKPPSPQHLPAATQRNPILLTKLYPTTILLANLGRYMSPHGKICLLMIDRHSTDNQQTLGFAKNASVTVEDSPSSLRPSTVACATLDGR